MGPKLVHVCFSFFNPKSPFWNYKYNIGIWLGIKINILEKVTFWVCEENAHSQNGVVRSILQKLLRVDESIRWVIGSVTKLPSLLFKTLTLPLINQQSFTPDFSFQHKPINQQSFTPKKKKKIVILLLLLQASSSAIVASSLIFFM